MNDNPLLDKNFEGQNEMLSDLEWDVKSYFTLGGAMHDAAIAAWSVKDGMITSGRFCNSIHV